MRQDARVKYPWAEWLNGQSHEYRPDNITAFRNYLYETAKRKELYVTATVTGETVRFQFFDSLESYQSGKAKADRMRSTNDGRFMNREMFQGINRTCTICGKRLTPVAPEDATECYRFDFSAGDIVKVHDE